MQYQSGDRATKSGNYNIIDESGKVVNTVSVKEGETFPPCPFDGCHFVSVEQCKNGHCNCGCQD